MSSLHDAIMATPVDPNHLPQNLAQMTGKPPSDAVLVLAIRTAQEAVGAAGAALDAAQTALAMVLTYAERVPGPMPSSAPSISGCSLCHGTDLATIATGEGMVRVCADCGANESVPG